MGDLALSLLLTCRTVYSEVQQILLAHNVFTAVLQRPGDLYHLCQSADWIRSMRHLLIYVKADEKMDQSLLCFCPGMAAPSLLEQPSICQTHIRSHMKEIFLEFREILKFILANTLSGTLELGLILFVDNDMELADWLLSPLLEKEAPSLADCAISLDKKYSADKAQLIYKYTTQSIANPRITTPNQPFRLADLPPELRRLVLSFTDLVVPGDEIEWLPPGMWTMHFNLWHELGCGYDELEMGRFPDGSCLHHNFSCAFSSSGRSQYCRCWGPPVAILLCSRWLYNEAMSVFLDMNTFTALPDWAGRFREEEPPTQLGTA